MDNNAKIAYLLDNYAMSSEEAIENIKDDNGFFGPNAWNDAQGYDLDVVLEMMIKRSY